MEAGLGRRDAGVLAVICVVWAVNFLTSKLALNEFPPLLFTALRLALMVVLLAPRLRRPPADQWRRLIPLALCNGVFHFGLNFWALQRSTTLASPSILLQSYVPMSSLLAWWWLGERLTVRTGLGIAVSFLGVLVLGFDPSVLRDPIGLGLMLTSAAFLATGTVLGRDLKGLDAFGQQGWTAVIGVVPLTLWSLAVEPPPLEVCARVSWIGWFGVVYAAIFGSLVGHGLFFSLVQRHPVARITPYLLATPLLATILGIVCLGNQVGPRLWGGGALILLGVLGIALGKRG